jgi:hypothetical protein
MPTHHTHTRSYMRTTGHGKQPPQYKPRLLMGVTGDTHHTDTHPYPPVRGTPAIQHMHNVPPQGSGSTAGACATYHILPAQLSHTAAPRP